MLNILVAMRLESESSVCGGRRWIKYEEKVESGGRWSKPHVSTPSLHSLFDLRSAIQRGTCIVELELDVAGESQEQTASLDRVAGKPRVELFEIKYFSS